MLTSRIRLPLRISVRSTSLALRTARTATNAATADTATNTDRKFEKLEADLDRRPLVELAPYRPEKKTWSSASGVNPYDGSNRQYISIPNILPSDRRQEGTPEHHNYFPTSGMLDATSMIGICLRRIEHVPRAYTIFRSLLIEYNAGTKALPEADVFGKVIEGISQLGKEGEKDYLKWRSKAERIVEQWEEAFYGLPAHKLAYKAVLERNGAKVYQGWFNGLVAYVDNHLALLLSLTKDPKLHWTASQSTSRMAVSQWKI